MQFVADLTYLFVEQKSFLACQASTCTSWLIVTCVTSFLSASSRQFKKIFFFFSFSLSSCSFNRFASNSAILLTPPAKFLLEHIHEKSFQDYPEWSNPIIFRIILKISKKLVVNEEWSNQAREKNAHLTCGKGRWLFDQNNKNWSFLQVVNLSKVRKWFPVSMPDKFIWKLLTFFLAVSQSFHVILAPSF